MNYLQQQKIRQMSALIVALEEWDYGKAELGKPFFFFFILVNVFLFLTYRPPF